MIHLKRAYDPPSDADGFRILVERLWPRGLTKEKAAIDLWLKEVAPSPELRKWYSHDPAHWEEFKRRYRAELAANAKGVSELQSHLQKGPVTFVYAARDEQRNSALLLKEFIEEKCRFPPPKSSCAN
jgi:uncharacterized protein YeaO (DUF488 family)